MSNKLNKRPFHVVDIFGTIISKCSKESRAISIANSRNYETKVVNTLITTKPFIFSDIK
jgi:hypothetical protein